MKFRDDDNPYHNKKALFQVKVDLIDKYDKEIIELKKLVNELNVAKRPMPYKIAIENQRKNIIIAGKDAKIPNNQIKQDINSALKGGKFGELTFRDMNPPSNKEYPEEAQMAMKENDLLVDFFNEEDRIKRYFLEYPRLKYKYNERFDEIVHKAEHYKKDMFTMIDLSGLDKLSNMITELRKLQYDMLSDINQERKKKSSKSKAIRKPIKKVVKKVVRKKCKCKK